ncbi:unnamed protein product, partial [Didymodactylos carnosus]
PENAEDYMEYLKETDRLDECAQLYTEVLNRNNFESKEGKSNHQAHDIFEEAVGAVLTVRDFTQVLDAYAQAEEGAIMAKFNEEQLTEDSMSK